MLNTIEEAIAGARILEKSAEAEIYSGKLNGLQYLDPTTAQELHKYYDGSYSKVNQKEKVDFISSGAEEFQLRNRIIDCGKDGWFEAKEAMRRKLTGEVVCRVS